MAKTPIQALKQVTDAMDKGFAKFIVNTQSKPYTGKITLDGTWYVSSSLKYAQKAAMDPGYVGRRGGGTGAWFTIVQNNLTRDLTRIMGAELRGV